MRKYYIIFLLSILLTINLIFPQLALADVKLQLTIAQIETIDKNISAKAALERLFTSEQIKSEWFAPEFLVPVPIEQVRQVIAALKIQLGGYEGVENNAKDYLIEFNQALVPAKIVLNNQGQISGLLFEPPQAKLINLKEAIAKFQALPGKVSLLVQEGKTIQTELNSKTPLAVGSAFKLAVLKALKSEIASKKLAWKDVVQLQPHLKSLPSGMLQTWPDNAYLTVETLASLMISLSDNTATDILINLIGKQPIELVSPRNSPFLTTRELFVLKGSQNRNLLKRYRTSKEAQRRAILQQLTNKPLPDVSDFEGAAKPVALDVEWLFTTQELCTLMEQVADLPLMSINPGVANPQDWQKVAFKGGSEPGVLNMTTWLQAKNGKNYCVVATWNNNDAPLEQQQFVSLYTAVIAKLATRE